MPSMDLYAKKRTANSKKPSLPYARGVELAKQQRAQGGCLGTKSR